jgi:hypothetical protein
MIEKWSSNQHFNDQLCNLNNDESTGTSSSSMVIGTSSSITGQRSSQSSKLEHLPRLRRQERENASEGSKKPTMSEKLNQMRIEDRRRAQNLEARQRSGSRLNSQNGSSPSSMRGNAPSFHPNLSHTNASSSASARAGTSYLAATQLSQQDSVEARRMNQLRRKFAGPVPPSSWTHNGNNKGEEQLEIVDEPIIERIVDRKRALAASRLFFSQYEHGRKAESSGVKHEHGQDISSLTDITLISIITALSDHSFTSSKQFEQKLLALPVHLKERALGLAGRHARTKCLGEAGLRALFGKSEGSLTEEVELLEEEDSFEEGGEIMLESWDNESEQTEWDTSATLSIIDLSFASISARSLKDLMLSPSIEANHIRALSLAGWGYGDDATHSGVGTMRKCLRTSTTLVNMLDQMTNLEMLSLAATKLLPGTEDLCLTKDKVKEDSTEESCTGLSPEIASEALAFLKKLARRTSNLRLLDLSACHWINGAVLSNIGIHSTNHPVRRLIWPRLQHLVLTDCPAFNEKLEGDNNVRAKPNQGTFTGQWHAAHHGIAQFTNSPYFLSHKPGLGRSVLAHGIGAWDSVNSNRNTQSLVGREAIALARHNGHVQRSRQLEAARRGGMQGLEDERMRSAFDDESLTDLASMATQSDGASVPGMFTGFAISHGVAPFASRRGQNSTSSASSSWSTPPRCPVSGKRVSSYEWERARVLDAIHGRWGSAIVGTLEDESEVNNGFSNQNYSRGNFITVYF